MSTHPLLSGSIQSRMYSLSVDNRSKIQQIVKKKTGQKTKKFSHMLTLSVFTASIKLLS